MFQVYRARARASMQGMRFCEMIKDDLAALAELPESTPELEAIRSGFFCEMRLSELKLELK